MFKPRTLALGLAVTATALSPAAAFAKHGADDPAGDDRGASSQDDNGGSGGAGKTRRDTRVTGSCTDGSTAKLKAKPDDGRLEVEFEVDQNRNGVPWKVTIKRNGRTAVSTTATTKAPSGSFSVERKIRNPAGSDRVSARATSPTGEVCTAALTI